MYSVLGFMMNPPSVGKKKNGTAGAVFYPGDVSLFLKYAVAGFIGFGTYSLAKQLSKRNIDPLVEFQDPVESMNCDPIIRDAFISVQSYRQLNPFLFKTALQNIDQLLFIEDGLLSQRIHPVKSDKSLAWTRFRVGCNRLAELNYEIRTKMGAEHALTFNLFVRKIYTQLQKHLLNILHLCSEFKPEALIARAPQEIARILQGLEENRKPDDDGLEKWERMKKKSKKNRHHHHRDHGDAQPGGEPTVEKPDGKGNLPDGTPFRDLTQQETSKTSKKHKEESSKQSRTSRKSHISKHSKHSHHHPENQGV